MKRSRISDLVDARRDARIERDDYWRAMQEHHLELADYSRLVSSAHLQALEVTPDGLYLRMPNGTRFSWDPSDFRSPPTVLVNEGRYEPAEWSVVRLLGGPAGTVLDVGANIGWYSIRLASEPSSACHVHAFEPVSTTNRTLLRNVGINNLASRVTVHPFGLSDREGVVPFYLPARTGSVAASERVLFDGEHQVVQQVDLRRLDEVATELGLASIGFIKCDIEGGEFGFLRGAEQVLREQRPAVLLEMLRKWSKVYGYHPNDLIEWMHGVDYVCASVLEDRVERIDTVTEQTEATNFLFTHRDQLASVAVSLSADFHRVHLD